MRGRYRAGAVRASKACLSSRKRQHFTDPDTLETPACQVREPKSLNSNVDLVTIFPIILGCFDHGMPDSRLGLTLPRSSVRGRPR
jgi:hypothetical protein